MKRIISLILILTTLFAVTSCEEKGNRDYDETEVVAAARNLIYKAEKLNNILWGEGFGFIEDSEYAIGSYAPADPFADYTSLEKLISDCSETFSSDYMRIIQNTIFSSSFGESGVEAYARYYQENSTDPIMVNKEYNRLLTAKNEFLYSTLEAVRSEGERVIVKITVKITVEEKDPLGAIIDTKTQQREREIELIEEAGKWKIDSPCYSNYNENL